MPVSNGFIVHAIPLAQDEDLVRNGRSKEKERSTRPFLMIIAFRSGPTSFSISDGRSNG